ncbi:unnamed protein product [Ectocarpus sp. CCAP 1310/34]|nr:unnamed protein product [Ectocarpus sp. CCAP 1310/34]
MLAASTLSLSVVSTAGFLLARLANRSSFCATQHGLGFGMMASAISVASAGGSTIAAEVQSNGDVTAAAAAFAGDAGSSPKRRRVSSDVTTRFPITVVEKQPRRLVVIADVHGDLGAFAETLLAAGLVDGTGNWAAGETVLVQAGDVFDRGDSDLEVEEWLWTLQEQATESGGAVYHLLGNHEIMNAMGDHSTASPKSFEPFQDLNVDLAPFGSQLDKFPDWGKPRLAAMAPGGPVSKMLASHSVAMKIGDTLLVHGGLRPVNFDPKSCRGATGMACLESLNRWTHEWLIGQGEMPKELWNRDSPVWTRFYSSPGGVELGEEAGADLQKVLDVTGTVRMIVGHTPQEAGINSALGGRLWRTDTGMTAMIGGQPEARQY